MKPDGKLMILPEFIYKFDNYIKELSYTKQGKPGDEKRMSLFMLYGIDQNKYATTINKFSQTPVYDAEKFIELKTELLRIDKKVNNELYGPQPDKNTNKKSGNQNVEKFQGNLATNDSEKTSSRARVEKSSGNSQKKSVDVSPCVESSKRFQSTSQANYNSNYNPAAVEKKRGDRIDTSEVKTDTQVTKRAKRRMCQCFKCAREHSPGCKYPGKPCVGQM
jgi:hypothetical protein